MIRVILVDNDGSRCNDVVNYFNNSSIDVVSCYENAKDFLESKRTDYDVLVINYLLNALDVFNVLEEFKNNDKKIVVFSEYLSKDMIKHLVGYNPSYIIKGSIDGVGLEKVIKAVLDDNTQSLDNDLNLRITKLLHSLGVPSHIKGFTYIRDSIRLLYGDSSLIGAITKELYPNVASINKTSGSKVERAIRHAIEVAWGRGDYDKMEEIFGNSVDFDRAKPTNSEFIVTVADRLKLEDSNL